MIRCAKSATLYEQDQGNRATSLRNQASVGARCTQSLAGVAQSPMTGARHNQTQISVHRAGRRGPSPHAIVSSIGMHAGLSNNEIEGIL